MAEQPGGASRQAVHPRGGRRLLTAAGAAGVVAAGAVVAGVFLVSDAGSPSAAYAVERAADGTVTVEIRSLRDAAGLERELSKAGVHAKVDFLAPGMTCREPRFTPARGRWRGRFTVRQAVRPDGTATFTLTRGQVSAGDTLVVTGSSAPYGDGPSKMAIAIARGESVRATRSRTHAPLPPPEPSGNDRGGPRLDESFGPDRGFQQRER